MCCTVDPVDPIAYVLSLNLHRRHLTTAQKSMVAARARDHHDKAAKERQKESGRNYGKGKPKVSENLHEPNGRSSDQAGAAVGVSGRSVDYATTVLEKGSKELIKAVDDGRVAVPKAASVA